MWRQVVAQSPGENAASEEVVRYDVGWKALNTMLRAGRSLSGHERNCCFLNTRGQRFADISAIANLDFDDDGRVLAPVDWDLDGDLDFWIANRTGPQVRFMRNDSGDKNHYFAVKLEGVSCNRDAIGARVELHLAADSEHPLRIKTLRAGEGYLAQSSRWLQFGLGQNTSIHRMVVRWPDGNVEEHSGLSIDSRYTVRQGDGHAKLWRAGRDQPELTPSEIQVPTSTDQSRIVLISPLPVPDIQYQTAERQQTALGRPGRARLVNLWTTWCQPCLKELSEWKKHESDFAAAGVDVLAINVDEPTGDREQQVNKILELCDAMKLPFQMGLGTAALVNQFDVLQRSILRRQQPLPVPSSFLIDAKGNLRVIYKGPIETQRVLEDVKLLDASPTEIVAASTPYAGIWLGQPAGSSPNKVAVRFVEGGFVDEAESYIRKLAKSEVQNPMYNPTEAMVLLGAICADDGRDEEARDAFRAALAVDPHHRQSHIELGHVLTRLGEYGSAATHYNLALERRHDDPELRFKFALALMQDGQAEEAQRQLETCIQLRPTVLAHHHLGNTLVSLGRIPDAVVQFEAALELQANFAASANNLAWILATQVDLLDAPRAVSLAEQMVASRNGRTAGNLDTLAAAYAAAGRFSDAIHSAQEAIQLADSAGDKAKAERIGKRLALYQAETAYLENE